MKTIQVVLQSLLKTYLTDNPGSEPQLSDELLVSIPTIKRWVKGKNLPASAMAKPIVEHFKRKVAKSVSKKQFAALLALRDAVIANYEQCQQDYDNERKFKTREGVEVDSTEAFNVLITLNKLARKCR